MKNIKIKFHNITILLLFTSLLSGYFKKTLMILFIVLFHEFGHVFITLLLGYQVESIEIYPFGGITKINKLINTPIIHNLLIASFGIINQLFLMFLGYLGIIKNIWFLKFNQSILLFNMLPIIPLDGAKFTLEVLSMFTSFRKALKYYLFISILGIVIYLVINYRYALNNYLIISLFIFKTWEIFKNRKVICHKFILERMLYDDILFSKIKSKNELPINYCKDVKYYYNLNGKLVSESDYLKNSYLKY